MNGVDFITDQGPMIEGNWYNPQTGDMFTVRDSFFQDGQLVVQATDGRYFDYNVIQNYVKSDKPIPSQKKKEKTSKKAELPKEVLSEIEDVDSGILDDDLALISGKTSSNYTEPVIRESIRERVTERVQEKSDDEKMVDRVLSRTSAPSFTIKIDWKKFPDRQLEMLEDFMGIERSLIANYYIDKLSLETIRETIAEQIASYIESQRNPENVKTTKPKKN